MFQGGVTGARVLRAASLVFALCVVPLLGAPEYLWTRQLLPLALLFFLVDLVQPPILAKPEQAGRSRSDRYSIIVVFITAVPCQVIPLLEWAYMDTPPLPWTAMVWGGAMMVTGAWLRVWSIRSLGRFFSGRVELQDGHELVREGPYRWIRHPSYTGAVLLLLGIPLWLRTSYSLGICAMLVTIAYAYRIPVEERFLNQEFGDAFERYRSETKRLIPYVW